MNGYRRQNMSKAFATILAAAFAGLAASPAIAQEDRASAHGLVEITRAVGTGIAYDIATDVLSSAFLAGEIGDQVSLLLPPRRRGTEGKRIAGEVVMLSTASYPIDLAGLSRSPESLAASGNGGARLMPSGYGASPGNLLFLAQFN